MKNSNFTTQIQNTLASLGPGILMATAAVGGSHLVASTQAGALYGWQLLWVIALVNLLKYPFFRAGVQYTLSTNQTLVEGYAKLGSGYFAIFTILVVVSAVVNVAGLTIFSANLLKYFLPIELSVLTLSAIILASCLLILLLGHYKALDNLSKTIMIVLVVTTILAVIIAYTKEPTIAKDFENPTIFSLAALGFIVVMMGWMPAPIEVSSITSLWLKRQMQLQKVTNKSALLDFNIGYIGTAFLALIFLALGALMLNGSADNLQTSGVGFTNQLISMYSLTIGEWSRYLIAIIAFFCIYGSTITVVDGYARAIAEAQRIALKKDEDCVKTHRIWTIILSVFGMIILIFFTSALLKMLEFAMILSFVTTPIFAWLNYKLLLQTKKNGDLFFSKNFHILCIFGLFYLFSFLALFIWWRWF